MQRSWIFAAVVFLSASPLQLMAATNGQILGSVTDSSGAAINAAQVIAVETATKVEYTTKANSQGLYYLLALPPGSYDLKITAAGFQTYQMTGIVIETDTAFRANAQMAVGSVNTVVSVSDNELQVETVNTQVGDVIQERKVQALPLNGRSYTDLLGLQPGVVPVTTASTSGPAPVPGNVSVSGARESSNGFQVNGANVDYPQTNGAAIVPNLDSIQEFRVLTNGFAAEYGNFSGGMINVITKSGTNRIHGSAFEFLRNQEMDAKNYYDLTKGALRRNQFGGTVGGPILKDKVFFFGDYQGTRELQGLSTGIVAVPGVADRTGVITDPVDNLTGSVNGYYWAQQLSQRLGYTVSNGEPYYLDGCTSSSQCVFPNGVIPTSAFTAPTNSLMPLIPLPNAGSNYSSSSNNQNTQDDMFAVRMDTTTRYGMVSGYYYHDKSTAVTAFGGNTIPGFPTENSNESHFANIGLVTTFNATTLNEARFSFMRFIPKSGYPTGNQIGKSLSSLGFEGIVADQPALVSAPLIYFNAFSFGFPYVYFNQPNNRFQWQDNLSKTLGAHTLKFGVNAHRTQVALRFPVIPNGTFTFDGAETGDDFADFLIGAPDSFGQQSIVVADERTTYLGLYAQDSWRARADLNINFGLRWEMSIPWYDTQNRTSTIVAGQQSTIFPSAPLGLVFPGDAGIPRSLSPTRYGNLAPRIGIAWSPSSTGSGLSRFTGGPGKFSVRASFGLFYQTVEGLQTYWTTGEAPFAAAYYPTASPLFQEPYVDRATGNQNPNPFPFSPPVKGQSFDFSSYLPISGYPFSSTKNVLPYSENFDLSVQRELSGRNVISFTYVGTLGHHLPASYPSNIGNQALCLSLDASAVAPGTPTCGPRGENRTYTLADGTTVNGTRTTFGSLYGDNALIQTVANSNYNSLQASLRHSTGRLDTLIGYTYSKSMDDSSGMGGFYLDPINRAASRSLSAFDLKHNFVASYDYELPFDQLLHRQNSRLASGWRVVGITHLTTGFPVTLSETDDRSLLGANSGGTNGGVDRPQYLGVPIHFTSPKTGLPFFNTDAFSPENLGTLGNASRRPFYGPGYVDTDLALLKDLPIVENIRMQFRAEFFNAFNRPSFMNPNGQVNSGVFGMVTKARDPRIGQVAVKIIF